MKKNTSAHTFVRKAVGRADEAFIEQMCDE